MKDAMVTLQLPTKLYDDLQSLAEEGQTEPVEVLTRLVETAIRERLPKENLTAQLYGALGQGTWEEYDSHTDWVIAQTLRFLE